jgi:hypothetical protein
MYEPKKKKTVVERNLAHSVREAPLFKSCASISWKDERGLVDRGIVVAEQFLLLLYSEGTERGTRIALGILATNHETDLAGRIGGDGRICIFSDWEDLLAILLDFGDQWEVEELVLG